jgi:hypothetical protein
LGGIELFVAPLELVELIIEELIAAPAFVLVVVVVEFDTGLNVGDGDEALQIRVSEDQPIHKRSHERDAPRTCRETTFGE